MIKGMITALITPFSDGNIDYNALNKLLDMQIEALADGILLLGTTAEAEMLKDSEKIELVKYVIKYLDGRIPIMIGIISNITSEVIRLGKLFDDLDIDSFLVINPYYIKSNVSGLLKHFTKIADSLNKPIIIYNVPKRTGMNIPFEVIDALSYHKNIIGLKDASGSLEYQMRLLNKTDFLYYCGDDSLMLLANIYGDGTISVISNAFPKLVYDIIHNNSKESYLKLIKLIDILYDEVSPIGIKYVLYCLGIIELEYRMPLDYPSNLFKRKIEERLIEFN